MFVARSLSADYKVGEGRGGGVDRRIEPPASTTESPLQPEQVLHGKLKNEKVFASSGGGGTDGLAQRKDLEERAATVPVVRIPKKEGPHEYSSLVV